MAELPVREQYVYSWGAARPGTGHTVSTPDRIELSVLAKIPQHTVSVLSPSDTQGRIEKTGSHAAQGTLHRTELLCKGRPGIKSER